MSTGDGDPSIPEAARKAHDAAVARGQDLYRDPTSGLWVMTSSFLLKRGRCCGNGCRHCPWPPEVQRNAGRPTIRPGGA